MKELAPLEFSVRYRLSEYLRFVTEHAFETQESLRELTGLKRRFVLNGMKILAAFTFFYKSSRVGECRFRIDSEGVCRHSKSGKGTVPWSKIKNIYMYSPGYLIDLQHGAMPIPFRVLSPDERESFDLLAGKYMTPQGAA